MEHVRSFIQKVANIILKPTQHEKLVFQISIWSWLLEVGVTKYCKLQRKLLASMLAGSADALPEVLRALYQHRQDPSVNVVLERMLVHFWHNSWITFGNFSVAFSTTLRKHNFFRKRHPLQPAAGFWSARKFVWILFRNIWWRKSEAENSPRKIKTTSGKKKPKGSPFWNTDRCKTMS